MNTKLVSILFAFSYSFVAIAQSLQDAQREIENENFVRARIILQKLLSEPSSDKSAVNFYLGNAYLKDDDRDSAKLFYMAAVTADPKSPLANVALGKLALLNGKKEEAKTAFDRALQITKYKNAEIFYQIGDAYQSGNEKNLSEAIKSFEEAVKLNPKNGTYLIALGDAYFENNEGGKALSKYEAARDADPKNAIALLKVARVNRAGKIYPDAIAAYEQAIKVNPELAVAYKELGETYYLTKQYDKVAPMFKKYVELNKEDAEAKTKYIAFLFQTKDYENVISEANKAIITEPENYVYYRLAAFANYELKRYKEGYEAAQKFWSIPNKKIKPLDYVYSAKLASQVGDTAKSISYFTIALENDPNNCELIGEFAKA
ncbi:MAG: tetratricopeptide repeat protein, partial [Chitinophagales bacterium]|nr:tetratricopeptide repeat protein [Chitinophagales bacterium]